MILPMNTKRIAERFLAEQRAQGRTDVEILQGLDRITAIWVEFPLAYALVEAVRDEIKHRVLS